MRHLPRQLRRRIITHFPPCHSEGRRGVSHKDGIWKVDMIM